MRVLVFTAGKFRKNLATLSMKLALSANRRVKFLKCSQLFIGASKEMPSVAAFRISYTHFWREDFHGTKIVGEIASLLWIDHVDQRPATSSSKFAD